MLFSELRTKIMDGCIFQGYGRFTKRIRGNSFVSFDMNEVDRFSIGFVRDGELQEIPRAFRGIFGADSHVIEVFDDASYKKCKELWALLNRGYFSRY